MRLIKPASWLPAQASRWGPLVETLLTAFLAKFDPTLLQKMLGDQLSLPVDALPGERALLLASECTAFHKLCQILARNPMVPRETRERLIPLESLPPSAIPECARLKAIHYAAKALHLPQAGIKCTKIGRGSVADVFSVQSCQLPKPVVLKLIRSDSLGRVRREAAILSELARESAAIGIVLGPNFQHALREALQDASRSLLREIEFPGEAKNLSDAREFYRLNERVEVPSPVGPRGSTGLFMEYAQGIPVLDNRLDQPVRRKIAQQLFRAVILEPLFSGSPEIIFHADPHAGNIRLNRGWEHPERTIKVILLDWSQAGRLPSAMARGIIQLCVGCMEAKLPSKDLIERLLGKMPPLSNLSIPEGGNPLTRSLEIIQQLAIEGMKVPLGLLLLRKSLLTIESIAHQLDPEFDSWKETLRYAGWVLLSEMPFRLLSLNLPWLDSPRIYRSGITTKSIFAKLANIFVRSHNFSLTLPLTVCDSLSQGKVRQNFWTDIEDIFRNGVHAAQ